MCDLPIPGSPVSTTTRPSPWETPRQRRNSSSISSSRPNRGVSFLSCCASKRLPTPLVLSPRHAGTGSAQPLSAAGPRSRYSNCPPVSRRVLADITTVPGSASTCRRAASFACSPTTACSCEPPSPMRSPTSTTPVAMPTRTCNGASAPVCRLGTASTSARPARTACSVVLMRLRITEIGEHAVAHISRHDSLIAVDYLGDAVVKERHQLAHVFGINPRRELSRADQIAKHHRKLASLGTIPPRFGGRLRLSGGPPLLFCGCAHALFAV